MSNNSTLELNFRVSGNGRPVVLLHGFLESMSMWEALDLHREFKCILIDLPGHGKSPLLEPQKYSLEVAANSVKKILDSLNVDQYDVIGHSMGGYVGLELKEMDEKCDKVVLLNSNFWSDSKEKQNDRIRVAELVKTKKKAFIQEAIPNLFMKPLEHDSVVSGLIRDASLMSSEAIAASSVAMSRRKDFSSYVDLNSQICFILQGKYDRTVPSSLMKKNLAASSMPYYELPTGHMAHIEATEKVKEVIKGIIG